MDPLSLILLAAGGAGVWYFFFRGQTRRAPDAVAEKLKSLGPDFTVFSGIVRMRDEGMDRIDHAVVSPGGVFIILEVVETGTLQCRMNAMDWPRRGPGTSKNVHNPVWRNRKRINSLEKELPEVPLINLVVVVNAQLAGDAGPEVVTFGKLTGRISANRQPVLSPEQVERAKAFFKSL